MIVMMSMTSNPQATRPLSEQEETVLVWIHANPGRTPADIVNAFCERPANHEDPVDPRKAVYQAIESLISEGWVRRDPTTHSIFHFEHYLF